MASRKQLLKAVKATSFRTATSGDLNNTTKNVEVNVTNSGKYAFLIGDIVVAFNETSYATPDLDPSAQVAIVTARSNTKITISRGQLGTPVTAIAGRATIGLVQRGGGAGDLELGESGEADNNAVLLQAATLTKAVADSGVDTLISFDGAVVTLPAVAPGLTYDFVNDGTVLGNVGFSISPAAADKIDGGGLGASVANKDVINTKATAKPGDRLRVTGGAANTWVISKISGVFAREA